MASESFTAANGTQLVALGTWANANALDSDFVVESNALRTPFNRAVSLLAYYVGTFADDQYAQGTITQVGSSLQRMGVAVRCSAGNGYFLCAHVGGWTLAKLVGFSFTSLASGSFTLATSDVLYLEAAADQIVAKRNGSTLATVTDTSHVSGNPGVSGIGEAASGTYTLLDAWQGGDLSIATGAAVRAYYSRLLAG